ncbi:Ig-like domain-containing protein, partial [bacterium]|nr:Ig-like domain-containing protein [bacterium]
TSPPIVTPSSPADATPTQPSLTLGLAANLVLSATETLVKGSGTVSIFKADNSPVEDIAINGGQVIITGTGTNTQISINPSADLLKDLQYYVKVSAGAFTDVAGNAWAGIADSTSWNFTGAGASVVVNAVAGNDVVNLAESGQIITVTGTLGAEASILAAYKTADMTAVLNGSGVTLNNFNYSYTSGNTTGTWSAEVPASALSGTADYTLSVTFTGTTGAAANIVGVGTKIVHVDTEVATPTLSFTDSGVTGDSLTNVDSV